MKIAKKILFGLIVIALLYYILYPILVLFNIEKYDNEMQRSSSAAYAVVYIIYLAQKIKTINYDFINKSNIKMHFKEIILVVAILVTEIIIIYYNLFLLPILVCVNFMVSLYFDKLYFYTPSFRKIKNRAINNIENCNELNEHIEELKKSFNSFRLTNVGDGIYTDESVWNYQRPFKENFVRNDFVCNCSKNVVNAAKANPFKYLCKYFLIQENEKSLDFIEKVFNDFSTAEQGKELLLQEQARIVNNLSDGIPLFVCLFHFQKLKNKIGFYKVNLNDIYFPKFEFRYTSDGGYSRLNFVLVLDIKQLEQFIYYLNDVIVYRNSIKGQRALLTSKLREKIKKRDNYACRICGNSIYNEPNLLLEIDHIIPISKGGKTLEANLQTLCWKCNRHKGNKIDEI